MDEVLPSFHAHLSEVLGIALMHEAQGIGFPGGEPELVDIADGQVSGEERPGVSTVGRAISDDHMRGRGLPGEAVALLRCGKKTQASEQCGGNDLSHGLSDRMFWFVGVTGADIQQVPEGGCWHHTFPRSQNYLRTEEL